MFAAPAIDGTLTPQKAPFGWTDLDMSGLASKLNVATYADFVCEQELDACNQALRKEWLDTFPEPNRFERWVRRRLEPKFSILPENERFWQWRRKLPAQPQAIASLPYGFDWRAAAHRVGNMVLSGGGLPILVSPYAFNRGIALIEQGFEVTYFHAHYGNEHKPWPEMEGDLQNEGVISSARVCLPAS